VQAGESLMAKRTLKYPSIDSLLHTTESILHKKVQDKSNAMLFNTAGENK
jgi:hypothetical protein